MPTNVGTRLAAERARLGISQVQFAERANVSRASQQNYEADKRDPDSAYLEAIARLGVDVQYVLTGVRSKNLDAVAEEAGSYTTEQGVGAISREEQKIIELYRLLRPPERTRLREIVDWLVSAKVKKDETGSG